MRTVPAVHLTHIQDPIVKAALILGIESGDITVINPPETPTLYESIRKSDPICSILIAELTKSRGVAHV